jgi:hypothetical protein
MIADCLRLAILPTIGGNFPFRRSLKRYFKYCNGEEDMGNARTTYLTGLTLTSLFAVGSVLVAQAAPADYRYSSHRHHYGHYGVHNRYAAVHGPYGATRYRYRVGNVAAARGYYGPARYRYGVGGVAAPGLPPQGYDYVGSYNEGNLPPQSSYAGGGLLGFGLMQSRPVYVLPDGSLTYSASDYYNWRGPAYGYGFTGPGPVAGPAEGAASAAGGALDAATLGILGPTNAPPPPPAPPPETTGH